jgi:hypothetical protein
VIKIRKCPEHGHAHEHHEDAPGTQTLEFGHADQTEQQGAAKPCQRGEQETGYDEGSEAGANAFKLTQHDPVLYLSSRVGIGVMPVIPLSVKIIYL